MKLVILTAIALAALSASVVQADNLQPASPTSPVSPILAPGSPGTVTPTPYPQVAPPAVPRSGGTEGSGPLLPKIEVPRPPRDQALPGLDQNSPAQPLTPPKQP